MNKVKEFFMWTGVGVILCSLGWGLVTLVTYTYNNLPYHLSENGKEAIMITVMCVLVGHMAKWIGEVQEARDQDRAEHEQRMSELKREEKNYKEL